MDLTDITTIKGFDNDGNELMAFHNVELKNLEMEKEVIQIIGRYGVTVDEFMKGLQILCAFGASSAEFGDPGPASDAETEIPNQKEDLEIFNQIVPDEPRIILNPNVE